MPRYPSTIMVSCVIPWTADEEIDERRFRAQADAALAAGYRHLYVFGTAGEGYAVYADDHRGHGSPLGHRSGPVSWGPMPGTACSRTSGS